MTDSTAPKARRGRVRRVVGKCYFCTGPVRAGDNAYVKDATTGIDRLVHRGACESSLRDRLGWAAPKLDEVDPDD